MARHDSQGVPRPSRSAVFDIAGPMLGRTRQPSTFIDCPVILPAGRRGRGRGPTRQTAPALCCRGPDRRPEPGRDLPRTVSGVVCMSTRRSRSGGRITVTSAAVGRGRRWGRRPNAAGWTVVIRLISLRGELRRRRAPWPTAWRVTSAGWGPPASQSWPAAPRSGPAPPPLRQGRECGPGTRATHGRAASP